MAAELAERVIDLPVEEKLANAAVAAKVLGPARAALGPAILYYGSMATPLRPHHERVRGPLPFTDPLVQRVVSDSTTDELSESSLENATSGIFVSVDRTGHPGAASGWCEWPEKVAQLGVLTAVSKRRQGLGLIAAEASISSAIGAGLLPQWRALEGNRASRALADQLGLVAFGRQYSFLPGE